MASSTARKPFSQRNSRTFWISDWGERIQVLTSPHSRRPFSRMRIMSSPPMPAMTAVSASPGARGSSPSPRRVCIRSPSPRSSICSLALERGPGLTSMPMAAGQMPRSTRQTGMYPWSVPTSATMLPLSTKEATVSNRSDNLMLSPISIRIFQSGYAQSR